MSIQYRVYVNDFAGGPVDYSAPVATVSGLTYTPAAIPFNSDVTYAIRAIDTVTGLEEQNVAARVRVVTGPAGQDYTARPRAPVAVAVAPGASGIAVVTWAVAPVGTSPAPTQFRVYAGTPTCDYSTPKATVSALSGRRIYTATLTGLTGGATYRVAVRSVNAAGEETNTAEVAFVAATAGPARVQSGGSAAVAGDRPPSGFPPSPPS